MAICKFVEELNRLRKSSSDSIDNIEKFDDFKKYMHITRPAEEDLKQILSAVNNSGKKTLVLLCGSAGDGKSHLLSFLRNEERLLDDYIVYNDATESSSPSKTAIETLNDVLDSFSDAKLDIPGQNIILAINLGVLSNFIESPYGENFKYLHQYVETQNILTTAINKGKYREGSHFQHVSFSDYHMYTLSDQGAEPEYILQILDKIFATNLGNPFFERYQKTCTACPMSQKCPVKHNYEFMTDKCVQRHIANSLVEVTIKEKEILTTREVLNYIYDILVAHKFSYKTISNATTITTTFLKEYLGDITPVLMYDYADTSSLLNKLGKYDPLLYRSEMADEMAIFYYVSADVSEEIKKQLKDTPYENVLAQKGTISKLNDDKALKAQIFNVLVRLQAIGNNEKSNAVYDQYIKDLYYYNVGKIPKLGQLYDLVEKAVTQWCGSESGKTICLDESHDSFTLCKFL